MLLLLAFPAPHSLIKLYPKKTAFILEKVCASHLALHFFKIQASPDGIVLIQEMNASQCQILLLS